MIVKVYKGKELQVFDARWIEFHPRTTIMNIRNAHVCIGLDGKYEFYLTYKEGAEDYLTKIVCEYGEAIFFGENRGYNFIYENGVRIGGE